MSQPSFAPFILARPWLKKWLMPLANWHQQAAGYQKLGLRNDDLIPEENETVALALKRLPPKEQYDRVFRMRRAMQCSLAHQLLPKNEWTTPEQDVPYLTPIIKQIEAEMHEREDLDNIVVRRPTAKK